MLEKSLKQFLPGFGIWFSDISYPVMPNAAVCDSLLSNFHVINNLFIFYLCYYYDFSRVVFQESFLRRGVRTEKME